MSSRLYNDFRGLPEHIQKKYRKLFETRSISYQDLAEEFTRETNIPSSQKSISKLMEEMGYFSRVQNGLSIKNIKSNEKEHIKLIELVGEEELAEEYRSSSLTKMATKYDTTSYVVKNALEYLNIELKPIPKTFKEIYTILEERGYGRDKIEKLYLDGRSFTSFREELGRISGHKISETSTHRLLKFLKIEKSEEMIREQQGKSSRERLKARLELLKKAGFASPEEVGEFYNNNPEYSQKRLLKLINDKIGYEAFSPRWFKRHVQPHIQHRSKTNHGVSREEIEFCKWLESVIPEGIEVVKNTYALIHPREIDIYIPSLNIAIEFNGLPWHEEAYMMKTRGIRAYDFHKDKFDKCLEKGVDLLYVWSDDWSINTEEVKSMIQQKINDPSLHFPQLQNFISHKDMSEKTQDYSDLNKVDKKIKKLYEKMGTVNAVAIHLGDSRAYVRQSLKRSGIHTGQFTYKNVISMLDESPISVEELQKIYETSTKKDFIDFVVKATECKNSIGIDLINRVIKHYNLIK